MTPGTGLRIGEALIPSGDGGLPAYVARPAGEGRHPAIVVVNEVFGVHEYIRDICRRLAARSYVAAAPAFFYRSGVDLPAQTDMTRIMAVVARTPDGQVDGDMCAAIRWLGRQPFARADAIGMTGFCWGGPVVWRSAMLQPDIRAGVAW